MWTNRKNESIVGWPWSHASLSPLTPKIFETKLFSCPSNLDSVYYFNQPDSNILKSFPLIPVWSGPLKMAALLALCTTPAQPVPASPVDSHNWPSYILAPGLGHWRRNPSAGFPVTVEPNWCLFLSNITGDFPFLHHLGSKNCTLSCQLGASGVLPQDLASDM